MLNFITPLPNFNYTRGENLTIMVEVLRANEPVEGATVTCKSPRGRSFGLDEVGSGIYSRIYKVEYDDPIGTWSITCQAMKLENGRMMAGGNFLNVFLMPALLNVSVLKPEESMANWGEKIEFLVEVLYGDGRKVEGAVVSLNFDGTLIPLEEVEPGLYSAKQVAEKTGEFSLVVRAQDAYGNYGKAEKGLIVRVAPTSLLLKYWWLLLLASVPSVLIAFKLTKKEPKEVRIQKEIKKLEEELKRIEEMERTTQFEYFRRKIDEKAFRNLMEEYKMKSIECQVKIKNLKEELERVKRRKSE